MSVLAVVCVRETASCEALTSNDDCFLALTWLRETIEVHDEMDEMRNEYEAMKLVPKTTLKEMVLNSSLRSPLIIAVMMMIAQQLSGINAVSNQKIHSSSYCLEYLKVTRLESLRFSSSLTFDSPYTTLIHTYFSDIILIHTSLHPFLFIRSTDFFEKP